MPFANYASAADVAVPHGLQLTREKFISPLPLALSDYFRSELALTLNVVPFDGSESAVCETLIYPLLREGWRPFHSVLSVWSHPTLAYDDDLCGTPDFVVAKTTRLGPFQMGMPCLMVVEAKKDEFIRGWGQCLAAMLAAQKINDVPAQVLYGISTNGRGWEFGKLQEGVFTQDPRGFGLSDLDGLAGALHFVFAQCRDQAARIPPKVVA
jgi:hypothetical protein